MQLLIALYLFTPVFIIGWLIANKNDDIDPGLLCLGAWFGSLLLVFGMLLNTDLHSASFMENAVSVVVGIFAFIVVPIGSMVYLLYKSSDDA